MSRDLWWDCDKHGCFNKKKRLKFKAFVGCFPGNIGLSDVDGIVEIAGKFVLVESKPSKFMPVGQRILFERLTAYPAFEVLVLVGDPETMTFTDYTLFRHGKMEEWREGGLERIRSGLAAWATEAAK